MVHKEQNTLQVQHAEFMFSSGACSICGTLKQTLLGTVSYRRQVQGKAKEDKSTGCAFLEESGEWAEKEVQEKN